MCVSSRNGERLSERAHGAGPPSWDLASIYPGLDSQEFRDATGVVTRALREVPELLAAFADAPPAHGGGRLGGALVAAYETATVQLGALVDALWTLQAYVRARVAADSRDEPARAAAAEVDAFVARQRQVLAQYDSWVASLDLDALFARSATAREHRHVLRRAAEAARHRMGGAEEALAASLSASGGGAAWERLRRDIVSDLVVRVRHADGRTQDMPQSATGGLFLGADGDARRAARSAVIESWERVAVPVAAALNGVKGELTTLSARRGWRDSLDPCLFANCTDRATLDALHAAVREALPVFRRFLTTKARLLGKTELAGWDLWAAVVPPGEGAGRSWGFHEAAAFIVAQFATYSHELSDLAARAFRERWVDAEPRAGKDPGGLSMPVRRGEFRILVNYAPSFHAVRTLAHELGHAYHNLHLWRRGALLRGTPLPLAETASAFCEAIVTGAAFDEATGPAKTALLNEDLQWACDRVVGMYGRFLLEQRICEIRAKRELSVSELKEFSLEIQRELYGDAVDPRTHSPFLWTYEHFFDPRPGRSYYNWPYTFSLLFGSGLYGQFRERPDRFRATFDGVLASTGTADVVALALRLGADVRSVEFWRASFDLYRDRVRAFEVLAHH